MKITVTSNAAQIMRDMLDMANRQAPFAISKGINDTVKDMIEAERRNMADVIDRPKPYTLGAVGGRFSSKGNLNGSVLLKDASGKNTPASKYLAAQINSGDRRPKRFEKALQAVGAMPTGYLAVPGAAAEIDAYGNISAKLINTLLAYFRAFPEMGYRKNLTDKRKAAMAKGKKGVGGIAYFVGQPGGHTPLGIWARYSDHTIKPVIIFVHEAHYKKLYDFYAVAQKTALAKLEPNIRKAMAEAMRTAR